MPTNNHIVSAFLKSFQIQVPPYLIIIKTFINVYNKLNLNKIELLTSDPNETGIIAVGGSGLPRTERFQYFGSMLSANGELRCGIASGVSATWMKWHSTP